MSRVVARWIAANEAEHGPYATFAGFEEEISKREPLCFVYDDLDIDEKTSLFAFVVDLLQEAAEKE